MRGGFFVREADGLVKQEQCFKEFAFPDRIAGVMEAMPRTERAAQRPSAPALPEIPLAQPAPIRQQAPISASAFEPVPYPSPSAERRRWPWLVAALGLVVVLAFVFLRYFWQPAPPEALGLQITEREGQLQIVWNPASRSIVRATKGLLEISDGDAAERVTLARAQMGEGRYLYTRLGGDVEVRMQVDTEDGPLSESARFLGRAPQAAKADELAAAQAQQTALEEENQKLKAENASLRDRIQQLERAQRILETRLGITGK
jgi:hypothetical protein